MAREHDPPPQLSQSDRMLIDLLRQGAPDAEIAVRLGVSVPDLRDRIDRMQARLGARDRDELVRIAEGKLPADVSRWHRPGPAQQTEATATVPEDGNPIIGGVLDAPLPPPLRASDPAEPRRYSRRKLLGLAGAAAAAGVAGGWLLTRETRQVPALPETATPTATPTFRVFPTPTPLPTPVPLDPIAEMVPKTGAAPFVRQTFEPNAPIEQEHGAFFMDTATGAVEGWWLPNDPWYRLLAGGRFVLAPVADTSEHLLDRRNGRAYSWPRDRMQLIAAHPAWLLVAETRRPGTNQWPELTGRFFLVAYDNGPVRVVSRFTIAERNEVQGRVDALFSPDGEHLVLATLAGGGRTIVRHIEPSTGRETARLEWPGWHPITGSPHGDLIQFEGYVEPPHRPDAATLVVRRRTWDLTEGPPTLEFPGTTGTNFSPDGSMVALRTWQRFAWSELGDAPDQWGALAFANATGEPLFRVRGAFMDTGDAINHTRWLADGSGYVAMVRDDDPPAEFPPWARGAYAIVRADGSGLEPLPAPPAEIRDRLRGWWGSPIPAPDRTDLFSMGKVALFNRTTGEWFAPEVPFSHRGHDRPWHDTSNEMMFVLDGGGHDGSLPPVMLPPRIETPPYDDRLIFRVSVDTWLNLRAEPSLEADVLDTLADGTIVEHAAPESEDSQVRGDWENNITWLRVRTGNGTTGWVDLSYLEWA